MKHLLVFLTLFCSVLITSAQSYVNSPYSRYGLGELQMNSEPVSFAMGGLSAPLRERFSVNASNPASYTVFANDPDSLPMVFNGGFRGNFSHQMTSSAEVYPFSVSLNSFSMGFKVAKNWGMAIGLTPYSSVGYLMQSEADIDSLSSYIAKYEGSGGFNRFYTGHAFSLFKNLSVGVNASYIFGSINQTRRIVFDTTLYFNTKTVSSRFVGDFAFDVGAQYELLLHRDTSGAGKNTRLIFGASCGLPSKLNATQDIYAYRYYNSAGIEIILDTAGFQNDVTGSVSLPMFISGGVNFIRDNHWSAGAEFRMQDWSAYESFGESDSLKSSLSMIAGFSYTPDNSPISKYYKKMTWFAGFHYDRSYLSLKGQQLTKAGISFGCTFPLLRSAYPRQQKAVLTTAFELGKAGTTEENLIEDNYFRFVIGISFKERWFEKRKYN